MLVVSENSYVDQAYANDYFSGRFWRPESAPWANFADAEKESALREAALHIDRLRLVGYKVAPEQALEFPRAWKVWEGDELGVHIEPDVTPNVKRAQCEEAFALLSGSEENVRIQLQREGVTSAKIGSTSETYSGRGVRTAGLLSSAASDYLRGYISSGAAFG